jgi:hypothetical protein
MREVSGPDHRTSISDSSSVTRADNLRALLGTGNRNNDHYLITVIGSKRHNGKTVPLRQFASDEPGGNWTAHLDTVDALQAHLDEGDEPAAATRCCRR